MKKFQLSGILLGSAAIPNIIDVTKPDPECVRRSALPIYPDETEKEVKQDDATGNPFIKNAVKSLRMQGCKTIRSVKPIVEKCSHIYETGVVHSYSSYINAVDYLTEEKNVLPRIGTIGSSVLVGYVFGRRSFFKRMLYSAITGSAAALICYPKEVNKYFESSLQYSKRYFAVGYHFMNGVAKDYTGIYFKDRQSDQDVKQSDVKAK